MGHTEVVRAILGAGARPGAAAEDGCTALMLAAEGGHEETVQLLLRAGASPKAKDGSGRTALGRTLAFNKLHAAHRKTIKLLLTCENKTK
eukprot:9495513-Pyramimonas_sp.AAC.1